MQEKGTDEPERQSEAGKWGTVATGFPTAGAERVATRYLVLLVAAFLIVGVTAAPGEASEAETPGSAPHGYRMAELGETVEFGSGHSLTVSKYEEDVAFDVESVIGSMSGAANLFWVEMCAGRTPLENLAMELFFQLFRPTAGGWESGNGSGHLFPGIREPRFNDQMLPETVEPGTCREGWVVMGAPDAETGFPGATAIGFDSSQGSFAPEELHWKMAWELE